MRWTTSYGVPLYFTLQVASFKALVKTSHISYGKQMKRAMEKCLNVCLHFYTYYFRNKYICFMFILIPSRSISIRNRMELPSLHGVRVSTYHSSTVLKQGRIKLRFFSSFFPSSFVTDNSCIFFNF